MIKAILCVVFLFYVLLSSFAFYAAIQEIISPYWCFAIFVNNWFVSKCVLDELDKRNKKIYKGVQ